MDKLRILAVIVASLATSATLTAQDTLFDNWNTEACSYTDSAIFNLQTPARLDHIEVWYRWRGRESSVPYTILHHGQTIRTGMLVRAECDPYQEAWCSARDSFEIEAGPGAYTIRTERPRVCQNGLSGGVGFVKAFGHPSRFGEERRHDRDLDRLAADVWHIEEGVDGRAVWVGTWTRRGRSDVFDAHWRNVETGAEASDTVRLIEARDRIVFHRDGNDGEYRGTLSREGTHMDGTASWYRSGWFWRAEAEHGRHDRRRD
jgi:hypothetical protein